MRLARYDFRQQNALANVQPATPWASDHVSSLIATTVRQLLFGRDALTKHLDSSGSERDVSAQLGKLQMAIGFMGKSSEANHQSVSS
jgi:hypothetical protein